MVDFAVGEFVNVKSEARLSAILTTSIILIVIFWMECPAEIMTVTGFGTSAGTMYSMTMVKVDDILTQWRTLITGFIAVCSIVALVIFVEPMIVPRQYAPAAAGGMPVYIMVNEATSNAGFKERHLAIPRLFKLISEALHIPVILPAKATVLF